MHIIFQNIPCHILTYLSIVFSLCKQVLLHKMQDDKIAVQKGKRFATLILFKIVLIKLNNEVEYKLGSSTG